MHAPGLFDLTDHLARLSVTGDPLEALKRFAIKLRHSLIVKRMQSVCCGRFNIIL